jgi:hypothetical protein
VELELFDRLFHDVAIAFGLQDAVISLFDAKDGLLEHGLDIGNGGAIVQPLNSDLSRRPAEIEDVLAEVEPGRIRIVRDGIRRGTQ